MKIRQKAIYLSVLVLLSAVLRLPPFEGSNYFRWDGANYYVLGMALGSEKAIACWMSLERFNLSNILLSLMAATFERPAGILDPAVVER